MKVELQRAVPPPPDINALPPGFHPTGGEWMRFSTPNAYAYVYAFDDPHPGYLVHWIESGNPGQGEGSSIMAAIGQVADRRRSSGTLVCEGDMIGWYTRFGWEVFDEFRGSTVMARFYRPNRHAS